MLTLLGIEFIVNTPFSKVYVPVSCVPPLVEYVTLVRLVQFSNADSPMLVTPSGIVTLVRLVQDRNAE